MFEAFNINCCQTAEMRHENEFFKKENARLSAENKKLRILADELTILKPVHAELVSKCEQLEKDLYREKDVNELLHRRLTTTQNSLESANHENMQLRAEVDELTLLAKELEELKVTHAAVAKHSAALERDLAGLSEQYEALLRRSEEMAARIAALDADLAEERRQHAALKAEHAELLELQKRITAQYKEYTDMWTEELATLRREGATYARSAPPPAAANARMLHGGRSAPPYRRVAHRDRP